MTAGRPQTAGLSSAEEQAVAVSLHVSSQASSSPLLQLQGSEGENTFLRGILSSVPYVALLFNNKGRLQFYSADPLPLLGVGADVLAAVALFGSFPVPPRVIKAIPGSLFSALQTITHSEIPLEQQGEYVLKLSL